jgi:hypothetical protein
MSEAAAVYPVSHQDGDSAGGLSMIVVSLLSENLAGNDATVRVARKIRRPIGLRNKDDGATATIEFRDDVTLVADGLDGGPPVLVEATVQQLLALSQLKILAGGALPVGFLTPAGMRIVGAILVRRLRVRGLFLHPLTVLRFLAVISVAR